MAVTLESLKTARYFARLETAGLADISRFIFERQLPAGEVILWEGDEDRTIYFVITGLVKLFATSAEGREFIIRIAYGGEPINDDNLFTKGPNLVSAATLSPVVLYGLDQADLDQILRTYPSVAYSIAEVLAARQRYMVRLATDLVFKSVTSRLAHLLLEREQLARAGGDNLKVTQQDMAFMIGTVRELVSRSLRELEVAGAISLKHNQIIISNRNRLVELSEQ